VTSRKAGDGGRGGALLELTRARILEFVREPEAVFWVFVFPVLMAVALGIAFRSQNGGRTPVALLDAGPAAARAELEQKLRASPLIELRVLDEEAAALALRKTRVEVVVAVDANATVAAEGSPPALAYRYDGARAEGRAARLLVDDVVQRAWGRADTVAARDENAPRRGARYIDFLIPGLIGLNLMGSGLWGIGFSVVIARTNKLLKRLAATPMRRSDYLLSIALSRLLFLGLEVAAIAGAGRLLFGVQVAGSILALSLVSLVGALSFGGIGLMIAARPRTVEAVSGWMNLVQLPMWLLSGTFFSYERFPEFALPLIRALPLTALNDALRGIMNDGLGLASLWSPLLVLLAWGLSGFVVAVKFFRWQ
jgi:ABC-type polysaccharide/polyol phosphate export permease